MDPTLAALIGAGIGSAGTLFAPWVTSRTQRAARRQEVKREAYAQGIRVITNVLHARNRGSYPQLKEALNEAQVQIQLVGSERTIMKFSVMMTAVEDLIDITEKGPNLALFKDARDAYAEFRAAARLDIGMEDAAGRRAWRWLQRWHISRRLQRGDEKG